MMNRIINIQILTYNKKIGFKIIKFRKLTQITCLLNNRIVF